MVSTRSRFRLSGHLTGYLTRATRLLLIATREPTRGPHAYGSGPSAARLNAAALSRKTVRSTEVWRLARWVRFHHFRAPIESIACSASRDHPLGWSGGVAGADSACAVTARRSGGSIAVAGVRRYHSKDHTFATLRSTRINRMDWPIRGDRPASRLITAPTVGADVLPRREGPAFERVHGSSCRPGVAASSSVSDSESRSLFSRWGGVVKVV